ncbi:hypothetical protein MAHJHV51_51620 [Mycobacterium avium subsp. hominissuis]
MERLPGEAARVATVQAVAEKRVADIGKMDTDLVRPAGVKPETHMCICRKLPDHFIMGARKLAIVPDFAFYNARLFSPDRGFNCAAFFSKSPFRERFVRPANYMLLLHQAA